VWHTGALSHNRYTVHLGERGRFVLPAVLRRRLELEQGDLLVLEVVDETLVIRKAADVAEEARGLFRDVAPGVDLAAELIEGRRAEAERETAGTDPIARR
jgi:AbrB family looped-hinge helix DNA binding protein